MLLLRLPGELLLRFAERAFLGLLFQEPPRNARLPIRPAPRRHYGPAGRPMSPPAILRQPPICRPRSSNSRAPCS